jgi:hypothetical protein
MLLEAIRFSIAANIEVVLKTYSIFEFKINLVQIKSILFIS